MSTNPYVAKAVAEATTLGGWLSAQAAALWSTHKTFTIVIVAAAAFVGHIL
jgi:hypothetical protein